MCRSSKSGDPQRHQAEASQGSSFAGGKKSDRAVTALTLSTIQSRKSASSFVDLEIAGVSTRLLLDNGAEASVLNRDALRKLPQRVKVASLAVRLRDFSGKLITNSGTISVPLRYSGERFENVKFFIVKHGASLLGKDLFDRLGFRSSIAETRAFALLERTLPLRRRLILRMIPTSHMEWLSLISTLFYLMLTRANI